VLDATYELVDGVVTEGEFLHVERVLPNVLDLWVCLFLEDVDDVGRLDLVLSVALLLLGATNHLQLTHGEGTLGTKERRTSAAMRIISQLLLYVVVQWEEGKERKGKEGKGRSGWRSVGDDDQMLMALSFP
jgi:hypothetical protein